MTAALEFTPADGWTTDDLDAMPEDGHRRELIDGVLHLPPSPSSFHRSFAGRLFAQLDATSPDGMSANQGVEIRISTRRALIPDVLVVKAAAAMRRPAYFLPDDVVLAVEIVSPSSLTMDRITKPALYAGAGIPYHWRIETDGPVVVTTYELESAGGVYRATGEHRESITIDQPWPIDIPIAAFTRI